MPRCKICKIKFEPKYFNQKTCVSVECILSHSKEVKRKEWNKRKQKKKEALKTKQDYQKELQVIFNKFIRLRDKDLPCISCQKPAKKQNAGHYRSVGSSPELRFNEFNCHLQCEYCNTYLHGNLIDYRINLIKKIGLDKVEWLEGKHEPKHYTKEQLKGLKEVYKLKIKNYEV